MAEITDKPSSQTEAPKWGVEALARATATAAVLIYVIGFVVVSVHDAQFGFTEFNPVRSRILFAGFIFACLTALPLAAFKFGFTQLVPIPPYIATHSTDVEQALKWVRLPTFLLTAMFMAFFSKFLFVRAGDAADALPEWVDFFRAVAFVLYGGSFVPIFHNIGKKPRACVLLTVLLWALLLAGALLDPTEASWQDIRLTLWYFAVGAVASFGPQTKDPLRTALHWGNWVLAVAFLWFYTYAIYGKMQQRYGGGAPATAVLYLNRRAEWTDSTVLKVKVLEQTGEGYYLILPNLDQAMFVPRSEVSALYFGSNDRVAGKKH